MKVFGLKFTEKSLDEIVVDVCNESLRHDDFKLLVTANVDHLVTLNRNIIFKNACKRSWIITADGFPVVKFLKFVGHDVKGRITGADLFPKIMEKLSNKTHSPFFVVSTVETQAYLVNWLTSRGFDNSERRVIVPPIGFEKDEQYTSMMIKQIHLVNATHLFMGVGAPKSEIWMDRNNKSLEGVKGFGFGAGIDFFAGTVKRAPKWMQEVGLEWFYRLISEPKRLAKRYLVSSWMFLYLATKEYLNLKR
ncbi:WecB/TagA/CpsF family glycosyltransferase [Shewanella gaetbuli]|uniref:WecB/TagA/CpsF family glycosyltransferase n=1 Tax=Shewanella gaetbuli TaxID=220752 RepID=A0A9X1ZVR0_9GAMM|nr:WecB/TagA/CpsF family glycosyltransferase [Shewanella gaetbuli]MCL1143256.1 WecB/TagA/CpsF family glycosyltransferase [Shewanella gaetbuli]